MSQGRRDFCKQVASIAACTGGLGAILPACSGGNSSIPGQALPTMNGTVVNGALSVAVPAGSPLSAVGGMALITPTAGNFLVTRTTQSTFVAVTAACTHQACVVSGSTGQNYVCPCHGSEFDTAGHVVVGPAVAPLAQHATQFDGNVLTIT
jgi:Rieske Fe-S protein